MAYAVEITLGTGNKVSLNYQSQEVNVSLTYRLEREDKDVLAVVEDKANELVRAHALAWKRVKEGERLEVVKEEKTLAEEAPVVEDAKEHRNREHRNREHRDGGAGATHPRTERASGTERG